jgi:hypothetical protein
MELSSRFHDQWLQMLILVAAAVAVASSSPPPTLAAADAAIGVSFAGADSPVPTAAERLRTRALHYQRQCLLYTGDTTRFRVGPTHFLHDRKFGFAYYEVPKAASTAIVSNLRAASPSVGHTAKGGWSLDIAPSLQLRDDGANASTNGNISSGGLLRFSCVREPVVRFVSSVNFLTVMDPSLQHLRSRDVVSGRLKLNGTAIAAAVAAQLYIDGFFNWHLWPQSVYLSRFDPLRHPPPSLPPLPPFCPFPSSLVSASTCGARPVCFTQHLCVCVPLLACPYCGLKMHL